MLHDRFDHPAAVVAADEYAQLLHVKRLRLSIVGMFADDAERAELEREIAQLDLREQALRRFLDDPYAGDSLMRIFHLDDRDVVIEAGRPDR